VNPSKQNPTVIRYEYSLKNARASNLSPRCKNINHKYEKK
jgi:hypothetical protein